MPQISSKTLFDKLLQQITVYESQEAKEIVFWLMEFYLGLSKIDILSDKSIDNKPHPRLSERRGAKKEINWQSIVERLNAHEPIQYILGETEFYGRKFLVNDSVLIPRPETEELVQLVIEVCKSLKHRPSTIEHRILDLGTGSGCIAITLAKELPDFKVFAYDISEKALETAKKNDELNSAEVIFEKVDILNSASHGEPFRTQHSELSIIVSNPPYVTKQEIEQMQKNVLDFEPHLALFVENSEPLIFYEAIADFALNHLANNGLVAVEINEVFGPETAEVFIRKGFSEVEIIKDIHQKDRFIRAKLHKKDTE